MPSLVFKKLNLCLVMPASWGVNQLATSHTVEHLSSIFLHSWTHEKPFFYLISHCINEVDIALNPSKQLKKKHCAGIGLNRPELAGMFFLILYRFSWFSFGILSFSLFLYILL